MQQGIFEDDCKALGKQVGNPLFTRKKNKEKRNEGTEQIDRKRTGENQRR